MPACKHCGAEYQGFTHKDCPKKPAGVGAFGKAAASGSGWPKPAGGAAKSTTPFGAAKGTAAWPKPAAKGTTSQKPATKGTTAWATPAAKKTSAGWPKPAAAAGSSAASTATTAAKSAAPPAKSAPAKWTPSAAPGWASSKGAAAKPAAKEAAKPASKAASTWGKGGAATWGSKTGAAKSAAKTGAPFGGGGLAAKLVADAKKAAGSAKAAGAGAAGAATKPAAKPFGGLTAPASATAAKGTATPPAGGAAGPSSGVAGASQQGDKAAPAKAASAFGAKAAAKSLGNFGFGAKGSGDAKKAAPFAASKPVTQSKPSGFGVSAAKGFGAKAAPAKAGAPAAKPFAAAKSGGFGFPATAKPDKGGVATPAATPAAKATKGFASPSGTSTATKPTTAWGAAKGPQSKAGGATAAFGAGKLPAAKAGAGGSTWGAGKKSLDAAGKATTQAKSDAAQSSASGTPKGKPGFGAASSATPGASKKVRAAIPSRQAAAASAAAAAAAQTRADSAAAGQGSSSRRRNPASVLTAQPSLLCVGDDGLRAFYRPSAGDSGDIVIEQDDKPRLQLRALLPDGMPISLPPHDIRKLQLRSMGDALLVVGRTRIVSIALPSAAELASAADAAVRTAGSREPEVACVARLLGGPLFGAKDDFGDDFSVQDAAWHPLRETHVVVLSTNHRVLMFDLDASYREPAEEFCLDYRTYSKQELKSGGNVAALAFGSGRGWERFTIFIGLEGGGITALCPVVPNGFAMPLDELTRLRGALEASAAAGTGRSGRIAVPGSRARQHLLDSSSASARGVLATVTEHDDDDIGGSGGAGPPRIAARQLKVMCAWLDMAWRPLTGGDPEEEGFMVYNHAWQQGRRAADRIMPCLQGPFAETPEAPAPDAADAAAPAANGCVALDVVPSAGCPFPLVHRLFRAGQLQTLVRPSQVMPFMWPRGRDEFGLLLATLRFSQEPGESRAVRLRSRFRGPSPLIESTNAPDWVLLESLHLHLDTFVPGTATPAAKVKQASAASVPSTLPRLLRDPLHADLLYVVHRRGVYLVTLSWLRDLTDWLVRAVDDEDARGVLDVRSLTVPQLFSEGYHIVGAAVLSGAYHDHSLLALHGTEEIVTSPLERSVLSVSVAATERRAYLAETSSASASSSTGLAALPSLDDVRLRLLTDVSSLLSPGGIRVDEKESAIKNLATAVTTLSQHVVDPMLSVQRMSEARAVTLQGYVKQNERDVEALNAEIDRCAKRMPELNKLLEVATARYKSLQGLAEDVLGSLATYGRGLPLSDAERRFVEEVDELDSTVSARVQPLAVQLERLGTEAVDAWEKAEQNRFGRRSSPQRRAGGQFTQTRDLAMLEAMVSQNQRLLHTKRLLAQARHNLFATARRVGGESLAEELESIGGAAAPPARVDTSEDRGGHSSVTMTPTRLR